MRKPLPALLHQHWTLPAIAAPMFLVTGVDLVAATCRAGVMGVLPTLNARSPEILDQWLHDLTQRVAGGEHAPWAVNLVSHGSNKRFAPDLALCEKYRAPVVVTALGSPRPVVQAVHAYGGLVFADVNSPELAAKAAAAGVDGLVLVCSGAGGHTGPMAATAFVAAVRRFWDGIVVVGGGIANGAAVRAVQTMGADFAYLGTHFIATRESMAVEAYKQMVVDSTFKDIICTNAITGAWANKLRPSLVAAGLDPDNLKPRDRFTLDRSEDEVKAWRDLWSAGHAVGEAQAVQPVAELVARLAREYTQALDAERSDPWTRRHFLHEA